MNDNVWPFASVAAEGTCADLIKRFDWATTPLGPIESWSAALTSTVANIVHTRQPMLLFWGPELIQFYNDAFVPSFGKGKHPTAMGQRARDCWADAWPVVGAQIEAVMANGEPAWHENTLVPIYRNGRMEEVFWTYSYSPAHDDHGRINGTLVIVTETTARVLAVRRLEALARFGFALSTASSHNAVFDAVVEFAANESSDVPLLVIGKRDDAIERCVGIVNEQAGVIMQVAVAAAPAPSPHDVVLERAPVLSPWPEPVSTLVVSTIGHRHVLAIGLNPRLPLDSGYHDYIEQISEQVGSALLRIDGENASRAAQRQRDSLLLQAPVATALMIGPKHVFQLANPLYCRVVGRNPLNQGYIEAFPELRDTELPGILDRVYQTGEPFVVSEMHVPLVRRAHGELEDCYFNFNLEPLRDYGNRVYGMMAVAVDITDQVRARQVLEKIGEERDRVLAELEKANRTKDDFLAMLGHELRNPLAPIVTALELLHIKDPNAAGSPERAVIERQLTHVVRLVDDLLDISKISRGVLSLDLHRVDVATVLDTVVETVAHLISHHNHRLLTTFPRDLFVSGDETRLVQAISNLLTNAARYTPNGGVIRLSATTSGSEIVIEVSDDGCGIAADLLPRVFESFVQGVRRVDRAEGGLGLGLAVVKNIVMLHGGRVSAHSDGPGRGSSFRVHLPLLVVTPSVDHRRPFVAEPATVNRRRVLIVDDNADAADTLGEIVRLRGHEVEIVNDPASALAVMGTFQPDVALLDIGLPGMDGYQLATLMRASIPACRLIAVTGYGQDSDRERTAAVGFAAHLVKPVNIDKLLATLAAA